MERMNGNTPEISRMILHPETDGNMLTDISIIEFENDVPKKPPICLPEAGNMV